MKRSIGIGHMQMDLGSISGRIEQGVAESLRRCSKSSSSDAVKFSVMCMFLGLDDEGLAGGR